MNPDILARATIAAVPFAVWAGWSWEAYSRTPDLVLAVFGGFVATVATVFVSIIPIAIIRWVITGKVGP